MRNMRRQYVQDRNQQRMEVQADIWGQNEDPGDGGPTALPGQYQMTTYLGTG